MDFPILVCWQKDLKNIIDSNVLRVVGLCAQTYKFYMNTLMDIVDEDLNYYYMLQFGAKKYNQAAEMSLCARLCIETTHE